MFYKNSAENKEIEMQQKRKNYEKSKKDMNRFSLFQER